MSIKSRNELKKKFENGDIPTEDDFRDLIDSFIHQDEDIIGINEDSDKVGIGTDDPAKLLHVAGDAQIDGTLCATGDVEVEGEITASGNVVVEGTITANSINIPSMGMIPQGGIIMWSGDEVPDGGWALCDGKRYDENGNVVNSGGIKTPDLRGRFIVGLTNTINEDYEYINSEKNKTVYNTIGEAGTGGKANYTITLQKSNIPPHHHEAAEDGANIRIKKSGPHQHDTTATFHYGYVKASVISDGANVWSAGPQNPVNPNLATTTNSHKSTSHHEHLNEDFAGKVGNGSQDGLVNAPITLNTISPYYVLAFIMKT